jgi:hypothetical protein
MWPKMWLLDVSIVLMVVGVLWLLHYTKVGQLFHSHVQDRPKRRLLLAAIGFFVTFAVARAVAYAAGRNYGPFHYIYIGKTHVHHLVWGILLLLIVGFCWLLEIGTGSSTSSLLASRLMSMLYGVGAALTLDEFSIWLNLQEGVYWTRKDRASIDAILLFGVALILAIWGRDFLRAVGVEYWQSRSKQEQENAKGYLQKTREAKNDLPSTKS